MGGKQSSTAQSPLQTTPSLIIRSPTQALSHFITILNTHATDFLPLPTTPQQFFQYNYSYHITLIQTLISLFLKAGAHATLEHSKYLIGVNYSLFRYALVCKFSTSTLLNILYNGADLDLSLSFSLLQPYNTNPRLILSLLSLGLELPHISYRHMDELLSMPSVLPQHVHKRQESIKNQVCKFFSTRNQSKDNNDNSEVNDIEGFNTTRNPSNTPPHNTKSSRQIPHQSSVSFLSSPSSSPLFQNALPNNSSRLTTLVNVNTQTIPKLLVNSTSSSNQSLSNSNQSQSTTHTISNTNTSPNQPSSQTSSTRPYSFNRLPTNTPQLTPTQHNLFNEYDLPLHHACCTYSQSTQAAKSTHQLFYPIHQLIRFYQQQSLCSCRIQTHHNTHQYTARDINTTTMHQLILNSKNAHRCFTDYICRDPNHHQSTLFPLVNRFRTFTEFLFLSIPQPFHKLLFYDLFQQPETIYYDTVALYNHENGVHHINFNYQTITQYICNPYDFFQFQNETGHFYPYSASNPFNDPFTKVSHGSTTSSSTPTFQKTSSILEKEKHDKTESSGDINDISTYSSQLPPILDIHQRYRFLPHSSLPINQPNIQLQSESKDQKLQLDKKKIKIDHNPKFSTQQTTRLSLPMSPRTLSQHSFPNRNSQENDDRLSFPSQYSQDSMTLRLCPIIGPFLPPPDKNQTINSLHPFISSAHPTSSNKYNTLPPSQAAQYGYNSISEDPSSYRYTPTPHTPQSTSKQLFPHNLSISHIHQNDTSLQGTPLFSPTNSPHYHQFYPISTPNPPTNQFNLHSNDSLLNHTHLLPSHQRRYNPYPSVPSYPNNTTASPYPSTLSTIHSQSAHNDLQSHIQIPLLPSARRRAQHLSNLSNKMDQSTPIHFRDVSYAMFTSTNTLQHKYQRFVSRPHISIDLPHHLTHADHTSVGGIGDFFENLMKNDIFSKLHPLLNDIPLPDVTSLELLRTLAKPEILGELVTLNSIFQQKLPHLQNIFTIPQLLLVDWVVVDHYLRDSGGLLWHILINAPSHQHEELSHFFKALTVVDGATNSRQLMFPVHRHPTIPLHPFMYACLRQYPLDVLLLLLPQPTDINFTSPRQFVKLSNNISTTIPLTDLYGRNVLMWYFGTWYHRYLHIPIEHSIPNSPSFLYYQQQQYLSMELFYKCLKLSNILQVDVQHNTILHYLFSVQLPVKYSPLGAEFLAMQPQHLLTIPELDLPIGLSSILLNTTTTGNKSTSPSGASNSPRGTTTGTQKSANKRLSDVCSLQQVMMAHPNLLLFNIITTHCVPQLYQYSFLTKANKSNHNFIQTVLLTLPFQTAQQLTFLFYHVKYMHDTLENVSKNYAVQLNSEFKSFRDLFEDVVLPRNVASVKNPTLLNVSSLSTSSTTESSTTKYDTNQHLNDFGIKHSTSHTDKNNLNLSSQFSVHDISQDFNQPQHPHTNSTSQILQNIETFTSTSLSNFLQKPNYTTSSPHGSHFFTLQSSISPISPLYHHYSPLFNLLPYTKTPLTTSTQQMTFVEAYMLRAYSRFPSLPPPPITDQIHTQSVPYHHEENQLFNLGTQDSDDESISNRQRLNFTKLPTVLNIPNNGSDPHPSLGNITANQFQFGPSVKTPQLTQPNSNTYGLNHYPPPHTVANSNNFNSFNPHNSNQFQNYPNKSFSEQTPLQFTYTNVMYDLQPTAEYFFQSYLSFQYSHSSGRLYNYVTSHFEPNNHFIRTFHQRQLPLIHLLKNPDTLLPLLLLGSYSDCPVDQLLGLSRLSSAHGRSSPSMIKRNSPTQNDLKNLNDFNELDSAFSVAKPAQKFIDHSSLPLNERYILIQKRLQNHLKTLLQFNVIDIFQSTFTQQQYPLMYYPYFSHGYLFQSSSNTNTNDTPKTASNSSYHSPFSSQTTFLQDNLLINDLDVLNEHVNSTTDPIKQKHPTHTEFDSTVIDETKILINTLIPKIYDDISSDFNQNGQNNSSSTAKPLNYSLICYNNLHKALPRLSYIHSSLGEVDFNHPLSSLALLQPQQQQQQQQLQLFHNFRNSQTSLTFSQNTQNSIHFPPLHQFQHHSLEIPHYQSDSSQNGFSFQNYQISQKHPLHTSFQQYPTHQLHPTSQNLHLQYPYHFFSNLQYQQLQQQNPAAYATLIPHQEHSLLLRNSDQYFSNYTNSVQNVSNNVYYQNLDRNGQNNQNAHFDRFEPIREISCVANIKPNDQNESNGQRELNEANEQKIFTYTLPSTSFHPLTSETTLLPIFQPFARRYLPLEDVDKNDVKVIPDPKGTKQAKKKTQLDVNHKAIPNQPKLQDSTIVSLQMLQDYHSKHSVTATEFGYNGSNPHSFNFSPGLHFNSHNYISQFFDEPFSHFSPYNTSLPYHIHHHPSYNPSFRPFDLSLAHQSTQISPLYDPSQNPQSNPSSNNLQLVPNKTNIIHSNSERQIVTPTTGSTGPAGHRDESNVSTLAPTSTAPFNYHNLHHTHSAFNANTFSKKNTKGKVGDEWPDLGLKLQSLRPHHDSSSIHFILFQTHYLLNTNVLTAPIQYNTHHCIPNGIGYLKERGNNNHRQNIVQNEETFLSPLVTTASKKTQKMSGTDTNFPNQLYSQNHASIKNNIHNRICPTNSIDYSSHATQTLIRSQFPLHIFKDTPQLHQYLSTTLPPDHVYHSLAHYNLLNQNGLNFQNHHLTTQPGNFPFQSHQQGQNSAVSARSSTGPSSSFASNQSDTPMSDSRILPSPIDFDLAESHKVHTDLSRSSTATSTTSTSGKNLSTSHFSPSSRTISSSTTPSTSRSTLHPNFNANSLASTTHSTSFQSSLSNPTSHTFNSSNPSSNPINPASGPQNHTQAIFSALPTSPYNINFKSILNSFDTTTTTTNLLFGDTITQLDPELLEYLSIHITEFTPLLQPTHNTGIEITPAVLELWENDLWTNYLNIHIHDALYPNFQSNSSYPYPAELKYEPLRPDEYEKLLSSNPNYQHHPLFQLKVKLPRNRDIYSTNTSSTALNSNSSRNGLSVAFDPPFQDALVGGYLSAHMQEYSNDSNSSDDETSIDARSHGSYGSSYYYPQTRVKKRPNHRLHLRNGDLRSNNTSKNSPNSNDSNQLQLEKNSNTGDRRSFTIHSSQKNSNDLTGNDSRPVFNLNVEQSSLQNRSNFSLHPIVSHVDSKSTDISPMLMNDAIQPTNSGGSNQSPDHTTQSSPSTKSRKLKSSTHQDEFNVPRLCDSCQNNIPCDPVHGCFYHLKVHMETFNYHAQQVSLDAMPVSLFFQKKPSSSDEDGVVDLGVEVGSFSGQDTPTHGSQLNLKKDTSKDHDESSQVGANSSNTSKSSKSSKNFAPIPQTTSPQGNVSISTVGLPLDSSIVQEEVVDLVFLQSLRQLFVKSSFSLYRKVTPRRFTDLSTIDEVQEENSIEYAGPVILPLFGPLVTNLDLPEARFSHSRISTTFPDVLFKFQRQIMFDKLLDHQYALELAKTSQHHFFGSLTPSVAEHQNPLYRFKYGFSYNNNTTLQHNNGLIQQHNVIYGSQMVQNVQNTVPNGPLSLFPLPNSSQIYPIPFSNQKNDSISGSGSNSTPQTFSPLRPTTLQTASSSTSPSSQIISNTPISTTSALLSQSPYPFSSQQHHTSKGANFQPSYNPSQIQNEYDHALQMALPYIPLLKTPPEYTNSTAFYATSSLISKFTPFPGAFIPFTATLYENENNYYYADHLFNHYKHQKAQEISTLAYLFSAFPSSQYHLCPVINYNDAVKRKIRPPNVSSTIANTTAITTTDPLSKLSKTTKNITPPQTQIKSSSKEKGASIIVSEAPASLFKIIDQLPSPSYQLCDMRDLPVVFFMFNALVAGQFTSQHLQNNPVQTPHFSDLEKFIPTLKHAPYLSSHDTDVKKGPTQIESTIHTAWSYYVSTSTSKVMLFLLNQLLQQPMSLVTNMMNGVEVTQSQLLLKHAIAISKPFKTAKVDKRQLSNNATGIRNKEKQRRSEVVPHTPIHVHVQNDPKSLNSSKNGSKTLKSRPHHNFAQVIEGNDAASNNISDKQPITEGTTTMSKLNHKLNDQPDSKLNEKKRINARITLTSSLGNLLSPSPQMQSSTHSSTSRQTTKQLSIIKKQRIIDKMVVTIQNASRPTTIERSVDFDSSLQKVFSPQASFHFLSHHPSLTTANTANAMNATAVNISRQSSTRSSNKISAITPRATTTPFSSFQNRFPHPSPVTTTNTNATTISASFLPLSSQLSHRQAVKYRFQEAAARDKKSSGNDFQLQPFFITQSDLYGDTLTLLTPLSINTTNSVNSLQTFGAEQIQVTLLSYLRQYVHSIPIKSKNKDSVEEKLFHSAVVHSHTTYAHDNVLDMYDLMYTTPTSFRSLPINNNDSIKDKLNPKKHQFNPSPESSLQFPSKTIPSNATETLPDQENSPYFRHDPKSILEPTTCTCAPIPNLTLPNQISINSLPISPQNTSSNNLNSVFKYDSQQHLDPFGENVSQPDNPIAAHTSFDNLAPPLSIPFTQSHQSGNQLPLNISDTLGTAHGIINTSCPVHGINQPEQLNPMAPSEHITASHTVNDSLGSHNVSNYSIIKTHTTEAKGTNTVNASNNAKSTKNANKFIKFPQDDYMRSMSHFKDIITKYHHISYTLQQRFKRQFLSPSRFKSPDGFDGFSTTNPSVSLYSSSQSSNLEGTHKTTTILLQNGQNIDANMVNLYNVNNNDSQAVCIPSSTEGNSKAADFSPKNVENGENGESAENDPNDPNRLSVSLLELPTNSQHHLLSAMLFSLGTITPSLHQLTIPPLLPSTTLQSPYFSQPTNPNPRNPSFYPHTFEEHYYDSTNPLPSSPTHNMLQSVSPNEIPINPNSPAGPQITPSSLNMPAFTPMNSFYAHPTNIANMAKGENLANDAHERRREIPFLHFGPYGVIHPLASSLLGEYLLNPSSIPSSVIPQNSNKPDPLHLFSNFPSSAPLPKTHKLPMSQQLTSPSAWGSITRPIMDRFDPNILFALSGVALVNDPISYVSPLTEYTSFITNTIRHQAYIKQSYMELLWTVLFSQYHFNNNIQGIALTLLPYSRLLQLQALTSPVHFNSSIFRIQCKLNQKIDKPPLTSPLLPLSHFSSLPSFPNVNLPHQLDLQYQSSSTYAHSRLISTEPPPILCSSVAQSNNVHHNPSLSFVDLSHSDPTSPLLVHQFVKPYYNTTPLHQDNLVRFNPLDELSHGFAQSIYLWYAYHHHHQLEYLFNTFSTTSPYPKEIFCFMRGFTTLSIGHHNVSSLSDRNKFLLYSSFKLPKVLHTGRVHNISYYSTLTSILNKSLSLLNFFSLCFEPLLFCFDHSHNIPYPIPYNDVETITSHALAKSYSEVLKTNKNIFSKFGSLSSAFPIFLEDFKRKALAPYPLLTQRSSSSSSSSTDVTTTHSNSSHRSGLNSSSFLEISNMIALHDQQSYPMAYNLSLVFNHRNLLQRLQFENFNRDVSLYNSLNQFRLNDDQYCLHYQQQLYSLHMSRPTYRGLKEPSKGSSTLQRTSSQRQAQKEQNLQNNDKIDQFGNTITNTNTNSNSNSSFHQQLQQSPPHQLTIKQQLQLLNNSTSSGGQTLSKTSSVSGDGSIDALLNENSTTQKNKMLLLNDQSGEKHNDNANAKEVQHDSHQPHSEQSKHNLTVLINIDPLASTSALDTNDANPLFDANPQGSHTANSNFYSIHINNNRRNSQLSQIDSTNSDPCAISTMISNKNKPHFNQRETLFINWDPSAYLFPSLSSTTPTFSYSSLLFNYHFKTGTQHLHPQNCPQNNNSHISISQGQLLNDPSSPDNSFTPRPSQQMPSTPQHRDVTQNIAPSAPNATPKHTTSIIVSEPSSSATNAAVLNAIMSKTITGIHSTNNFNASSTEVDNTNIFQVSDSPQQYYFRLQPLTNIDDPPHHAKNFPRSTLSTVPTSLYDVPMIMYQLLYPKQQRINNYLFSTNPPQTLPPSSPSIHPRSLSPQNDQQPPISSQINPKKPTHLLDPTIHPPSIHNTILQTSLKSLMFSLPREVQLLFPFFLYSPDSIRHQYDILSNCGVFNIPVSSFTLRINQPQYTQFLHAIPCESNQFIQKNDICCQKIQNVLRKKLIPDSPTQDSSFSFNPYIPQSHWYRNHFVAFAPTSPPNENQTQVSFEKNSLHNLTASSHSTKAFPTLATHMQILISQAYSLPTDLAIKHATKLKNFETFTKYLSGLLNHSPNSLPPLKTPPTNCLLEFFIYHCDIIAFEHVVRQKQRNLPPVAPTSKQTIEKFQPGYDFAREIYHHSQKFHRLLQRTLPFFIDSKSIMNSGHVDRHILKKQVKYDPNDPISLINQVRYIPFSSKLDYDPVSLFGRYVLSDDSYAILRDERLLYNSNSKRVTIPNVDRYQFLRAYIYSKWTKALPIDPTMTNNALSYPTIYNEDEIDPKSKDTSSMSMALSFMCLPTTTSKKDKKIDKNGPSSKDLQSLIYPFKHTVSALYNYQRLSSQFGVERGSRVTLTDKGVDLSHELYQEYIYNYFIYQYFHQMTYNFNAHVRLIPSHTLHQTIFTPSFYFFFPLPQSIINTQSNRSSVQYGIPKDQMEPMQPSIRFSTAASRVSLNFNDNNTKNTHINTNNTIASKNATPTQPESNFLLNIPTLYPNSSTSQNQTQTGPMSTTIPSNMTRNSSASRITSNLNNQDSRSSRLTSTLSYDSSLTTSSFAVSPRQPPLSINLGTRSFRSLQQSRFSKSILSSLSFNNSPFSSLLHTHQLQQSSLLPSLSSQSISLHILPQSLQQSLSMNYLDEITPQQFPTHETAFVFFPQQHLKNQIPVHCRASKAGPATQNQTRTSKPSNKSNKTNTKTVQSQSGR